ncbi:hypothetical protein O6H91_Y462800 [Diphasiastrum complanatum]|nr:hypothetical protein O6H91_Y462800 [Diphasiastrum complanatum]
MATASVANVFVADQGWYVATTVVEHFPLIHASAVANGFKLHRCLTVLVENGYVRKGAFQEVTSLLMSMYYRTGFPCPKLHSLKAAHTYKPKSNWVLDTNDVYSSLDDIACRGGAERYVIDLFTEQEDVIIDLFAGTRNMAIESVRRNRHCVCVEKDEEMFTHFLSKIEAASKDISTRRDFKTFA